jgi:N-carbamoyl-L-amino-acid hydrolase
MSEHDHDHDPITSDGEPPAVTRVLYTKADLRARAFLKQLCTASGLEVREDPVGNLFARWTGTDAKSPGVATGSHIDAIPHSGRYDGTVGVLGGHEPAFFRRLRRRR